jgi:CDP-glucose 4,6-dehydratase
VKNVSEKFWLGKRVLLTGHTGFKGAWLGLWLNRMGAQVTGVSLPPSSKPNLFTLANVANLTDSHFIDIRNADTVANIVEKNKPEIIFHLAAQALVRASYRDPLSTLATNIMGPANVLDALLKTSTAKVVVAVTTDKVYENLETGQSYKEDDKLGGYDPYSASKAAAEIVISCYRNSFLKQAGIALASARAGNVIGGGDWSLDRIVPDCYRAWSMGQPIQIRNPNSTRPWQHVLEPLSGYLTLGVYLKNGMHHGGDFNFGPNFNSASFSVERLITDLYSCWPGDKSYTPYHVKPGAFKEAGLLRLNCDKALQYLNWFPTCTYEETIQMVGNWYHEYYLNSENMIRYTNKQIDEYELLGKERNCIWAQD